MKPSIRQQQILARARAIQKEWRVEELAEDMRVSAITIRRDLDCLGRQGAIIRTLGGCLIDNRRKLAAYHDRVANNFGLKQAIGRAAAREIRKGNVILINDGSTTFHLAGCLNQSGPITVYTNSVVMIGEISAFANVRLNILGGEYRPNYFYLGGSLLERVLETISADIAFIGTDAVSPDGGCYCQQEDTARIAQLMMRRTKRSILLADHTKAGARAHVRFAGLKDFDLWITSGGLKRRAQKNFKRLTCLKEIPCEL
jgi:DeoR/GlpR family transcriptional regulator of sugar metabolism